jgi:hypothetical protein
MTRQQARDHLLTRVDAFVQAFGDINIADSDEERIVRKFTDFLIDESEEDEDLGADSRNTKTLIAMGR